MASGSANADDHDSAPFHDSSAAAISSSVGTCMRTALARGARSGATLKPAAPATQKARRRRIDIIFAGARGLGYLASEIAGAV